jgi:Leucine-rich repeat (LRR) protein
MTPNWSLIHPEFSQIRLWSEYFHYQWTNSGFDYQQTQAWINADLRPWEANLAWWLVNIKKLNPQRLNRDDIEKLRKEYFASEETIDWLKKGFIAEEIKQWLSKGLNPNESDLANYLKVNNLALSAEIKQDYCQAQNWLNLNYPLEIRNQVKELPLVNLNLQGALQLSGFPNLERIYCADNKLTSLECYNCPKLKTILTNRNQLTNLTLKNCPNITKLVANKNQLTSLDFLSDLASEKLELLNISGNNISESDLTPFTDLTNLRHLGLGNWYKKVINQEIYNRLVGSLEPLANMNRLEELDLAGTDVTSGWEHLPSSLQTLYLFSKERPDSQVQIIADQLKQYGETAKDRHEDDNFALLLIKYKNEKQIQELKKEKEHFVEQQKEISYLELRVNELTDLIKEQKEKIIQDFLTLFPEQEQSLLKELITIHLEFTKAKKQGLSFADSRSKRDKLRNELENKLQTILIEKIEFILDDCENLVNWEIELELRLNNKTFLIEGQKSNPVLQLTYNSETSTLNEIQEWQGQVKVQEVANTQQLQELDDLRRHSLGSRLVELVRTEIKSAISGNKNFIFQLVNQLRSKILVEQAIINKIKKLLILEQRFITARQETIQELRECCDILESTLIKGKYAQNDERTNLLTIAGKVAGCWTFNLIEATGQAANLTNAHFQRLFTIKQGEQFQISLKDEPEIQVMEQTYQELLVLFEKEFPLFANDYKLYEVITNIWEGKAHIDVSDMKDALASLTANWNLLTKEIQEQEKSWEG